MRLFRLNRNNRHRVIKVIRWARRRIMALDLEYDTLVYKFYIKALIKLDDMESKLRVKNLVEVIFLKEEINEWQDKYMYKSGKPMTAARSATFAVALKIAHGDTP